ncbi:MAG: metal-dependent transcriptional regulator [Erysipelotrichaceae bacterium]|nr:metal-dependent transcriptional regulator [Erysipelotrichaceae bacterium]
MKLQESGEDYLESILKIERTKGVVRSVDVANDLNVSKPSVSRAMHILAERGFIQIEDNVLVLSESGRKIAEKIYERHVLFTNFLIQLGVDEAIAAEDACRMEHTLSDESYAALKRFIEAHQVYR